MRHSVAAAMLAALLALAGCSTTSAAPVAGASAATSPARVAISSAPIGEPEPSLPTTALDVAGSRCPVPPSTPVRSAPQAKGWSGKTVVLTFDDGPGPYQDSIVAFLAKQKIPAVFFQTGAHAAADPQAQVRLHQAGLQVANHTYDHRYPKQVNGGWSVSYLSKQLSRTTAVLTQQTGQRICLFRPPGGHMTNVMAATKQAGLTVVMWSVDTRDWAQPAQTTTAATAAIVKAGTTVGSQRHPVVLMHAAKASAEPESQVSSNRGNTVAALPKIIAWYRAHGFRFVDFAGHSAR